MFGESSLGNGLGSGERRAREGDEKIEPLFPGSLRAKRVAVPCLPRGPAPPRRAPPWPGSRAQQERSGGETLEPGGPRTLPAGPRTKPFPWSPSPSSPSCPRPPCAPPAAGIPSIGAAFIPGGPRRPPPPTLHPRAETPRSIPWPQLLCWGISLPFSLSCSTKDALKSESEEKDAVPWQAFKSHF